MVDFSKQWDLVDEILVALGFDKSAGERLCSFELRIAVDEWPQVWLESRPDKCEGTITRLFEVRPIEVAASVPSGVSKELFREWCEQVIANARRNLGLPD